MIMFRFLVLTFVILAFTLIGFSQDKQSERQTRMLRIAASVLDDAAALRLPENRAVVFAYVGSQLWEVDEKRARGLFQDSISELIKGQTEAEDDLKTNQYGYQSLLYGQIPRSTILDLIAARDAEMAVVLLRKSRPRKLDEIMSRSAAGQEFSRGRSQHDHYASFEFQLERRLTLKAAEQNPARAAELLRESLKTGVSYETYYYLQTILQKDEQLAQKLTEEVASKVIEMDLENYQNYSFALYFLQETGREHAENEKFIKVPLERVRELAGKVSEFLLDSGNNFSLSEGSTGYLVLKNLFPDRTSQIIERQKRWMEQNQNKEAQAYTELMQNNPTPEEMAEQAERLPNYRSSIYSSITQNLTADGRDISRAINILTRNLPEDEANNHLSSLFANLANQKIGMGSFDEAAALIHQIPLEERRIQSLIYLASSIYRKNIDENGPWASSVLDQADALVPDQPANRSDMIYAIMLAGAYAQIEPARAFRLMSLLIGPLNEYSKAVAKVSEFRNEGRVRRGEFLITLGVDATGEFNIGQLVSVLRDADLDRTLQMIDGFGQYETRIGLKLQILDFGAGRDSAPNPPSFRANQIFELN